MTLDSILEEDDQIFKHTNCVGRSIFTLKNLGIQN